MKRLLLFFAFIACISVADAHRYYCVITRFEKAFSGKTAIQLIFGRNDSQRIRPNILENAELLDKDGHFIKLLSVVDAMNFMSERGWIFQQAYTTTKDGDTFTENWILYKDAETKEEARKGILTKEEIEKMK